jgi:hypothetical protein
MKDLFILRMKLVLIPQYQNPYRVSLIRLLQINRFHIFKRSKALLILSFFELINIAGKIQPN